MPFFANYRKKGQTNLALLYNSFLANRLQNERSSFIVDWSTIKESRRKNASITNKSLW
jgi:hypothetical protein